MKSSQNTENYLMIHFQSRGLFSWEITQWTDRSKKKINSDFSEFTMTKHHGGWSALVCVRVNETEWVCVCVCVCEREREREREREGEKEVVT